MIPPFILNVVRWGQESMQHARYMYYRFRLKYFSYVENIILWIGSFEIYPVSVYLKLSEQIWLTISWTVHNRS